MLGCLKEVCDGEQVRCGDSAQGQVTAFCLGWYRWELLEIKSPLFIRRIYVFNPVLRLCGT